jgi:hypothetical protein
MKNFLKKIDYKTDLIMILIGLLMIYGFNVLTGYPIFNMNRSIEKVVIDEFDNQYDFYFADDSVEIRDKIKIDNQIIVYFEFNDGHGKGWMELERGLLFNYRLSRMIYSLQDYEHFNTVLETNKGKYVLIMGENPNHQEDVSFFFNNQQYTKSINKGDYYIVYMKVSDDTPDFFMASEIELK